MKSVDKFIVYLPKKVKDSIKLGDSEIYIETKFNEFEHRYNYGTVAAVPSKYSTDVKVGDILYFHHHIVVDSSSHIIDEDHYFVSYDPNGGYASQAYAYERDGKITMLNDWIFVKAQEPETEEKTAAGIFVIQAKKMPNEGVVYLSNPELEEWGVSVGNTIGFSKNSDYLMELSDGTKVWRMRNTDLNYVKES